MEDIQEVQAELLKLRAIQDERMDMRNADVLRTRLSVPANQAFAPWTRRLSGGLLWQSSMRGKCLNLQPSKAREYRSSLDMLGKRVVNCQCVAINRFPARGKLSGNIDP